MFNGWRRQGGWPIGCAFADDAVRVVQLCDETSHILETVRLPLEADRRSEDWPSAATAALRQALGDHAFSGRQVVSCLPIEQMRYRHLRLAPMPDAELAAAVRYRTAQELNWSVEQLCVDYFDVGEVLDAGKRRHEVIAVAAAQQDVEAHAAMLHAAGCTLTALDADAGALARCLSPMASTADGDACRPRFIIEMGSSGSALIVVHQGLPRFIRTIDIGRREIITRAARAADLGEHGESKISQLLTTAASAELEGADARRAQAALDEAFVSVGRDLGREVMLCLHYLSQARLFEFEPDVGCVIGAGSGREALTAALNDTSRIAFEMLETLLVPGLQRIGDRLPADTTLEDWLLPIGLALYGREDAMQGVAA
ncbi:MAG: pilus assembly protein PilM [Phycisphaeraceae bacterium]